jgi:hypothetical protein
LLQLGGRLAQLLLDLLDDVVDLSLVGFGLPKNESSRDSPRQTHQYLCFQLVDDLLDVVGEVLGVGVQHFDDLLRVGQFLDPQGLGHVVDQGLGVGGQFLQSGLLLGSLALGLGHDSLKTSRTGQKQSKHY